MSKRTLGLVVGLSAILGAVWFTSRFFSSTALPGGRYALWRGAVTGNAASLRRLSVRPQDIDEQDAVGWTPLLLAAATGHTAAVRVLLEKGANVNMQDKQGRTALIRATTMGYGDIVRLLLDAGADVRLADKDGNTALHHAAYGNTNRPEASGLWARLGPLGIQHIEAPRGQYATIARELLASGADVDCKNGAGQKPLAVAVGRKNSRVAQVLKPCKAQR